MGYWLFGIQVGRSFSLFNEIDVARKILKSYKDKFSRWLFLTQCPFQFIFYFIWSTPRVCLTNWSVIFLTSEPYKLESYYYIFFSFITLISLASSYNNDKGLQQKSHDIIKALHAEPSYTKELVRLIFIYS